MDEHWTASIGMYHQSFEFFFLRQEDFFFSNFLDAARCTIIAMKQLIVRCLSNILCHTCGNVTGADHYVVNFFIVVTKCDCWFHFFFSYRSRWVGQSRFLCIPIMRMRSGVVEVLTTFLLSAQTSCMHNITMEAVAKCYHGNLMKKWFVVCSLTNNWILIFVVQRYQW